MKINCPRVLVFSFVLIAVLLIQSQPVFASPQPPQNNSEEKDEQAQPPNKTSALSQPSNQSLDSWLLWAAGIGGTLASVLGIAHLFLQRNFNKKLEVQFQSEEIETRLNELKEKIESIDKNWMKTLAELGKEVQSQAAKLPKDPLTKSQLEKLLSELNKSIQKKLGNVTQKVNSLSTSSDNVSFKGQFASPFDSEESGVKNAPDTKQIEKAKQDNRELSRLNKELESTKIELQKKLDSAEANQSKLLSDGKATEDQLASLKTELAEMQNEISGTKKKLLAQAEKEKNSWFDSFYSNKELESLRELIENSAEEGSAAASLVKNSLNRCSVLSNNSTERELCKEIHVLGSYCYRFAKEIGDSSESEKALSQFATAVEQEFSNIKIRRAHIGLPKDQTWMNAGAGNTPVQAVDGWAVLDQRGTALFRAEVS